MKFKFFSVFLACLFAHSVSQSSDEVDLQLLQQEFKALFKSCRLQAIDEDDPEDEPVIEEFYSTFYKIEDILKKEKDYRLRGLGIDVPKLCDIICECPYGSKPKVPLATAVKYENEPMIQLLIGYGADVNGRDEYDDPILKLAIGHTYHKGFDALLTHHANANLTNNSRQTALMLAVMVGEPYFIEKLLEAKADANARNLFGDTALHGMAEHYKESDEFKRCAELLLNHPAIKINAKNKKGQTPAHVSAVYKTMMLLALKNHGADFNIKDHDGKTALEYATPEQLDSIR